MYVRGDVRVVTSVVADGDMSLTSPDGDANRNQFYTRLGLKPEHVMVMPMGRSAAEIVFVGLPDGRNLVEADALITAEPGIALGLLTADCIPLAFFAPDAAMIALAHCGWRGVDLGLAGRVVDALRNEGVDPSTLFVSIGPSIRKESYRQPSERVSQKNDPTWLPFIEDEGEHITIDLHGLLKQQLTEKGVLPKHIDDTGVDTYTDVRFFSHRRARETAEPDGRMLSLVWRGDVQSVE